jgi:hypothetical protein
MSNTRKEEISLTARSFVQLIDRDALRQHVEEEQKQSNRPSSILKHLMSIKKDLFLRHTDGRPSEKITARRSI